TGDAFRPARGFGHVGSFDAGQRRVQADVGDTHPALVQLGTTAAHGGEFIATGWVEQGDGFDAVGTVVTDVDQVAGVAGAVVGFATENIDLPDRFAVVIAAFVTADLQTVDVVALVSFADG